MQQGLKFFEKNKNTIESFRTADEIIVFFAKNNISIDENLLNQFKLKYKYDSNSTKLNNSQLEEVAGGGRGGRGRSLGKGSPAERRSRSADPRLEQHIYEDLPVCPSAYLGTYRPHFTREIPDKVLNAVKDSTDHFLKELNNDDNPHPSKRPRLGTDNPSPPPTPLYTALTPIFPIPDIPNDPNLYINLEPFMPGSVYPLPPTPMKSRMPVPTVFKNLQYLDLAISPSQVITDDLPQTVPSSPVIRDEEVPSSPNFT